MKLLVATQYNRNLGPRYKFQSPKHDSGEEFRESLLLPALKKCIKEKDILYVVFDGCSGAGVSFLEESFGGLIRAGVQYDDIKKWMKIEWKSNPRKKEQAEGYIKKAYEHKKGNI